jgi:hypothetical protein
VLGGADANVEQAAVAALVAQNGQEATAQQAAPPTGEPVNPAQTGTKGSLYGIGGVAFEVGAEGK